MTHDDLLTVSQVANVLNVSAQTVREWSMTDVLCPDEVTSRGWRLYRRETVEKFMNERMNEVKI